MNKSLFNINIYFLVFKKNQFECYFCQALESCDCTLIQLVQDLTQFDFAKVFVEFKANKKAHKENITLFDGYTAVQLTFIQEYSILSLGDLDAFCRVLRIHKLNKTGSSEIIRQIKAGSSEIINKTKPVPLKY